MTRKRERIFALFGALLFLGTSSALTVAVILQQIQQHKQSTAAASPTKSSQTQAKESNKNMLQGTQLENFTPIAHIAQLQEIDTTPGSGETVKASDTITVDYTGAVASTGVIFQSSKDSGQTATFPLNQVIAGWTQGIPGMKVGGTRRLLIPASLAYAANPPSGSGIPVNADLVFDVVVHKIGK